MIHRNHIAVLCAIGIMLLLALGCEKEDSTLPANPYDEVDYGTPSTTNPIELSEFETLHNTIFQPRCAIPGCHDGHFEPDFRTVMSSYSTLVYHPIVKNNLAEEFTFRVVPNDTAKSVLHERLTNCCFVNQDDRMPQDNIGVPLEANHITAIENWIMNGAPDMFEAMPSYPNTAAQILSFYVAATDLFFQNIISETENRVDSVQYNPFYAPDSSTMYIALYVEDDSTANANMQVNQLKLSFEMDDFTSAQSYSAIYVQAADVWLATINTTSLLSDTTYYMRYYANDGHQTSDTEFPRTELIFPYKTYWAFRIKAP